MRIFARWRARRARRRLKYERMRVLYGGDYITPAGPPLTSDEIALTLDRMESYVADLPVIIPVSGPWHPHS